MHCNTRFYELSSYEVSAALQSSLDRGDLAACPAGQSATLTLHRDSGAALPLRIVEDYSEDLFDEDAPSFAVLGEAIVLNGQIFPKDCRVETWATLITNCGREIALLRIGGVDAGVELSGGCPAAGAPLEVIAMRGAGRDEASSPDPTTGPTAGRAAICVTLGTMISTPAGPCPVEQLRHGDLVSTHDHGACPIKWTSRSSLRLSAAREGAKPVQIKAGALAPGFPATDLTLSPQQRIAPPAESEAFEAAGTFVHRQGVRRMHGKRAVDYVYLVLDEAAVVFANGLATQSVDLTPAMAA